MYTRFALGLASRQLNLLKSFVELFLAGLAAEINISGRVKPGMALGDREIKL